MDRKTIYRIERATYSTSIDHLAVIAKALGVDLASRFHEVGCPEVDHKHGKCP
ncbi:helix-turn-helix transcriptional regulator [Streptomyces inhibens]|nr:helix-turn-helix transcriptional regulator [Streptomyces inhibens]